MNDFFLENKVLKKGGGKRKLPELVLSVVSEMMLIYIS